jgi:imidazolonepropionase-like amidohydrolase
VLVRDGKIAEVGTNVNLPPGATVVDASGQYLMPGIIDCHSHIIAEAINEGTVSVSSMVGIGDVLNPEDIAIYRALAGGVTTATFCTAAQILSAESAWW